MPAHGSLDEPASPARLQRGAEAWTLCGAGNVTADEVVLLFLKARPGADAAGFDLPQRSLRSGPTAILARLLHSSCGVVHVVDAGVMHTTLILITLWML